MRLIYLIGEPGVGKSTLMAALTRRCEAEEIRLCGQLWGRALSRGGTPVGVEVGRRRERFSGTDALGMAVMPDAIRWITDTRAPTVLGEGDRLGSAKFLTAARDAGSETILIVLSASPETLTARREQRGSNQSATWLQGRQTKIRNLIAASPADRTVTLDAERPTAEILGALLTEVPTLHRIAGF